MDFKRQSFPNRERRRRKGILGGQHRLWKTGWSGIGWIQALAEAQPQCSVLGAQEWPRGRRGQSSRAGPRTQICTSDERAGSPERHLRKREKSIHGQFKEEKGRAWRRHTSLGTWQKFKNELRHDDRAKDEVAERGDRGNSQPKSRRC